MKEASLIIQCKKERGHFTYRKRELNQKIVLFKTENSLISMEADENLQKAIDRICLEQGRVKTGWVVSIDAIN